MEEGRSFQHGSHGLYFSLNKIDSDTDGTETTDQSKYISPMNSAANPMEWFRTLQI